MGVGVDVEDVDETVELRLATLEEDGGADEDDEEAEVALTA